MKKIILIVAVALTASFANAQSKGGSDSMSFGVKGGLDIISFKATGYSENLTGFFAGGFVEFGIAEKFVLQPGLNYHTASKTVSGTKLKANYLSVPVLVKYEIADKFNLIAGPALYYSLESTDNDKTRFNFEVGASYGITENFFIEPRYSAGLNGDVKVSHILVGVGYKF